MLCFFFSNLFDPSRLTTNVSGNQIDKDTGVRKALSNTKFHLETETDNVTGTTTRYQTAGYQPLVVNHLISKNQDIKSFYYDKLKNSWHRDIFDDLTFEIIDPNLSRVEWYRERERIKLELKRRFQVFEEEEERGLGQI